MNVILDTNILVDYLNGVPQARREIGRHRGPIISMISWMEILIGAQSDEDEQQLRQFLGRFRVAPITNEVAEGAVRIRRERGLRLPDALIWATAVAAGGLLVTRNTKDFPASDPGVRVPYRL